jgi:hypothetical protein
MLDPASAAKLFAELRDADPLKALRELSAWLEEAKDISADDEKARSDILALIQEAGDAHLFKLLAQSIARQSDHQAARESNWNALSHYLRGLTDALCASARRLLEQAATNPSLQLPAAAGAARGLHACRILGKLYLVRYLGVPPKLWQLAYAVHGDAEKADCAAKPVRMHAAQKAATTVTRELLGLLMLQSSSPEMMTPEQIEVADRVIEQLGGDFTLGPRGSADNTFRFDPGGDQPPQRSTDTPDADVLYFGPGMGFDALKRVHMELAQTRRAADVKPFGQDIAPHVQASAIRHLMLFWGQASPYTAPARSEATGTLKIIHGYAQIWQQLSSARSATSELSLAEDSDATAAQAPESWTLQATGGNELVAQVPLRSGDWARSGDVVGVSMGGDDKYWLGLIRSMHAEPGHGMRAHIAILSGEPQAVQLRLVIEQRGVDGVSEKAAQQFAFSNVRAIILSDGSTGSQKANFLLPPEHWEGGRVYEGTVAGTVRHLHSLQLLRRGDDYVRASFEWVSVAQG